MGFPDATAAEMIDYATGRAVAQTAAFPVYMVLLTADPGSNPTVATLSEDTTPGYARQQAVWGAPSSDSPPVSSTSAQIAFGPFTAAQTYANSHVALVTSASGTGGEVRWVQALDTQLQAASGDSHVFPAGSVTMGVLS